MDGGSRVDLNFLLGGMRHVLYHVCVGPTGTMAVYVLCMSTSR